MDDLMGKLQAVLSDPESMNQVMQLANMMGLSQENNNPAPANNNSNSGSMPDLSSLFSALGQAPPSSNNSGDNSSNSSNDLGIDIGKIMMLQGVLKNASQNDKNVDLLIALKPLLSEERQVKVDKAVKMLKLFTIFTAVKESGLLGGDLLGLL